MILLTLVAATTDTLLEQLGAVSVAVIGAIVAMKGIQRSQNRQKAPKIYELTHDEAIARVIELQFECVRLREQRNAYRLIIEEHGLERRHLTD